MRAGFTPVRTRFERYVVHRFPVSWQNVRHRRFRNLDSVRLVAVRREARMWIYVRPADVDGVWSNLSRDGWRVSISRVTGRRS